MEHGSLTCSCFGAEKLYSTCSYAQSKRRERYCNLYPLLVLALALGLKVLQIHLFYIANSDNLAFVVYDTFNQSWSNHTELVDSGGCTFRAAIKSRTLLAKRLGVSTPSLLKVLLHYENPDGNVTVLEGVNSPPSASWAMQDVTSKLNSSLQSHGILSVPCSSMRKGNAVRLIATEKTDVKLSENATAVTADYEDGKFNTSRFQQQCIQTQI